MLKDGCQVSASVPGKATSAHHDVLTDSLTRPAKTGETRRDLGDSRRSRDQVSETYRNRGGYEDARRGAHNPAIYRARFVPERADIRGLQRSLADSASDGQAGPEQVDPLPETTF